MKLTVIEKALKMYKARGDWSEQELLEITNAESELSAMRDAATDEDYCAEVYVIPTTLMVDFGNKMWYDTYGRMARRLPNDSDIPANFINAIKQEEYVSELAPHILEDIHGLLDDLWHENEAGDYNDTDGTYKARLTQEDIDWICELIHNKLDDERGGETYERYFAILQRLHQERDYRKTGHWTSTQLDIGEDFYGRNE